MFQWHGSVRRAEQRRISSGPMALACFGESFWGGVAIGIAFSRWVFLVPLSGGWVVVAVGPRAHWRGTLRWAPVINPHWPLFLQMSKHFIISSVSLLSYSHKRSKSFFYFFLTLLLVVTLYYSCIIQIVNYSNRSIFPLVFLSHLCSDRTFDLDPCSSKMQLCFSQFSKNLRFWPMSPCTFHQNVRFTRPIKLKKILGN